MSRWYHSVLGLVASVAFAAPLAGQHLLVPMDDAQTNHLKAYGLTYNALRDGQKALVTTSARYAKNTGSR